MTSGDPTAPLILVNPRAARLVHPGDRERIADAAIGAVRHRFGREPRVEADTLEATRAAVAEAADAPLVVVIGGDGTVREAATGLIGRETPLAIIPAGTGNVLAAAVGIRGVRSGLDAIRHGSPRTIDLGRACWTTPTVGMIEDAPLDAAEHERIFAVACGMGLDARIMAAAEHEWKRRIRFGAYVGAAVRELMRLETARFHIKADDETLDVDGYLVLVANAGELVPGRVGPRRAIDPADGQLDLIVVGGRHPVAGLRSAVELMVRSGELDGSVIRRSIRSVVIEADPAQPIETDGDPHPAGRLEAEVIPGALNVLVPGG
jgi:diacylglycerol kinase (ATP)